MIIVNLLLICVLVCALIPMQATQLALEARTVVKDKKEGKSSLQRILSKTKIGKATTKKNSKGKEKVVNFIKNTNKSVIKIIRTTIISLSVSTLLMGLVILLVIVTLIGATTIVALNFSDEDSALHQTISGSTQDGSDSGKSSGTMVDSIKTIGDWLVNDVKVYSQETTYACPALNNLQVRPDCSGYASAVIQSIVGADKFSVCNSNAFANRDGATCAKLKELGFEIYDATQLELSDLKEGDLLARNGHVEFYMGEGLAAGWGAVHKSSVYKSSWSKKEGGIFQYDSPYVTVIRYVGK